MGMKLISILTIRNRQSEDAIKQSSKVKNDKNKIPFGKIAEQRRTEREKRQR